MSSENWIMGLVMKKEARKHIWTRGVARNFLKMKPANKISEILAEANCMCIQRFFKESLDVWLISAKQ